MWVLPTYARPQRCQAALDSIAAAGCVRPGIVVVDGPQPGYADMRLPDGWRILVLPRNLGVCGVLNQVLQLYYPDEPWYGFISDDSLVRTPAFDRPLIEAAGATGFANSGDGWQAQKRMHGAVVFGGDLLRAIGWWAPPGLKHSFVDDAWEKIARALGNWRHVPQVMVEHCHARNAKAEQDETYTKAYSTFEDDRATFRNLLRREIPEAINRALPVAIGDDPEACRLARAKSRSVMIATPIARHPTYQYTLGLTDTVLLLDRTGIEHARQFVIGSSNLPRARNELVARFLASRCTDLLFVDDDMGWDANAVVRLLASDKPLCGVVGRKRVDKPNTDQDVWCGVPDCGPENSITQDDMGFVRFKRVGTGFLKIARTVFEQVIAARPDWKRAGHAGMSDEVRANYYRFFRFGDDEYETGEDFEFCNAWAALGGEIWVDPDIALAHVGEKEYRGAFSELMQPAEEAKHQEFQEAAE